MGAQFDHAKRDALHAARAEISIAITKYTRRLHETAFAYIDSERAKSSKGGSEIDGTALGRQAATVARTTWIGIDDGPEEAIETSAVAITDGQDPGLRHREQATQLPGE